MLDWIRFVLSALFLLLGLFVLVSGVLGVFRFRQTLNRIHAAALIDTLGIASVFLGLIIAEGMRYRLQDHFRGYRVAAKKGELQLIYFVNAVINEATEYATYDAWVEQAAKRAEELGM